MTESGFFIMGTKSFIIAGRYGPVRTTPLLLVLQLFFPPLHLDPVLFDQSERDLRIIGLGNKMYEGAVLVREKQKPIFAERYFYTIYKCSLLVKTVLTHLPHNPPFHLPDTGDHLLKECSLGHLCRYL